jgi:hypothetical protein
MIGPVGSGWTGTNAQVYASARRRLRVPSVAPGSPSASLETVGVDEGHEQAEVLFLTGVRSSRQEQEVPGRGCRELAELVTEGLPHVVAVVVGRHPSRDHHYVYQADGQWSHRPLTQQT